MLWTTQRQRFRAVLAGTRCVYPASVFDPISARIAELLGFEVGTFAGSLGALTVFGAPDLTLVTLSEFAEQAYRICRAGTLPLMVDTDHGYGNALNVMRTVEELESAGAALIMIEDTVLPRQFGQRGKPLASIEETVGKLRAAVRARQDPALIIAGRSQAARSISTDELVERARAYEATGVDALFFGGVKDRAQLETLSSAVSVPLMLGGAPPDLIDLDYLARHRVRVCNAGQLTVKAVVQAIHETMSALRAGMAPSAIPHLASDELMDRVTGASDYAKWTREFLGGDSLRGN